MKKYVLIFAVAVLAAFTIQALPANAQLSILRPNQGGTGIGSVTAGDIGKCLKVLAESPFSFELGTCGTGGAGTPGGANGQLQFNNNGSFAGTSSPTVGYITSTTTATSTFAGGIQTPGLRATSFLQIGSELIT